MWTCECVVLSERKQLGESVLSFDPWDSRLLLSTKEYTLKLFQKSFGESYIDSDVGVEDGILICGDLMDYFA